AFGLILQSTVPVKSITTNESQTLVLDGNDVLRLTDKRILLVDDVISTGGSLTAAENLMAKVDANVVYKCAILAEGTAATRDDITVLGSLPVFPI
ncbi:phosphoribosyltransferase family protein, partial [Furfurilactobacillus rossiae]|uniref:phosphoribosyltransferase family protein n=1 Tax=Furfurilactobacillus rossiae TaxID=231049 RepID=UPI000A47646A